MQQLAPSSAHTRSEATVVVGAEDEDSRFGFGEADNAAGSSGTAYIYA